MGMHPNGPAAACLAVAILLQTAGHALSGAVSRVSTAFDSDKSTTCGIQEAMDGLPETGGTVYVPAGDVSLTPASLSRR